MDTQASPPPTQGPKPSLQHTLASSTFLIKMQHTLNSICMTGFFFFLPREALYKVCQVAAVRAEVAFPSVMLTAAVLAQAEWNGNDIMFIQERRFQSQISVSKMLGCSRRENTLETNPWISFPGTHSVPHSTHLPPHPLMHTLRTHHASRPHQCTQTLLYLYHTPHTHTHTNTTNACNIPHILPPDMSHKHISTHATMTVHTHALHVHRHKHPEACTHTPITPNLYTGSHKSHTYLGRGRAVGMGKKLQVLK